MLIFIEYSENKMSERQTQIDEPCTACDGTGKELDDEDAFTFQTIASPTVTMRNKAVHAGDPCRYCHGTGRTGGL